MKLKTGIAFLLTCMLIFICFSDLVLKAALMEQSAKATIVTHNALACACCKTGAELLIDLAQMEQEIDRLCKELECLVFVRPCVGCEQFTDVFALLIQQIRALIQLLLEQSTQIAAKFGQLELDIAAQEQQICAQFASIEQLVGQDFNKIIASFTAANNKQIINNNLLLLSINALGTQALTLLDQLSIQVRTAITIDANQVNDQIITLENDVVENIGALFNSLDQCQEQLTTIPHALFTALEFRITTDFCAWCSALSQLGAKLAKHISVDNENIGLQLATSHDQLCSKISGLDCFITEHNTQLIKQVSGLKASAQINKSNLDSQLKMTQARASTQITAEFAGLGNQFTELIDNLQVRITLLCSALKSAIILNSNIVENELVVWLSDFCAQMSYLQKTICTELSEEFAQAECCLLNKFARVLSKLAEIEDGVCVRKQEALALMDQDKAILNQLVCTKVSTLETKQTKAVNRFDAQLACFQADFACQICSKFSTLALVLGNKSDELIAKIVSMDDHLVQLANEEFDMLEDELVQGNNMNCQLFQSAVIALQSQLCIELSDLDRQLSQQSHNLCVKINRAFAALVSQIDEGFQSAIDDLSVSDAITASQISALDGELRSDFQALCTQILSTEAELISDIDTVSAQVQSANDAVTLQIAATLIEITLIIAAILIAAAELI